MRKKILLMINQASRSVVPIRTITAKSRIISAKNSINGMVRLWTAVFVLSTLFLYTTEAYASLVLTSLTSGSSTTNATSYATASITPTANSLVIAVVYGRRNPGLAPSGLSGNGLTWVQVADTTSTALTFRHLTVFRAMGSSPSSGAVTISYAGTMDNASWSIFEISGTDTSGTNGSGAIVQSGTNADPATGTSGTITLSAFGSTSNMAIGSFAHNANEVTTPGSGFTEIDDIQIAENTSGNETEYKLNDNTVDASWATSIDFLAIAIEVKAATASTRNRFISVE